MKSKRNRLRVRFFLSVDDESICVNHANTNRVKKPGTSEIDKRFNAAIFSARGSFVEFVWGRGQVHWMIINILVQIALKL